MKRLEKESYEDYKKRRAENNSFTKKRLKGLKVWPGDWGTYIGDVHGKVEDKLKAMIHQMQNKKDE